MNEWEARRIAKGRETVDPLWNFVCTVGTKKGEKKQSQGAGPLSRSRSRIR